MWRVALEHFYSRWYCIYSRHWGSKLENSIQMSNSYFFHVCCYAGGATMKKRMYSMKPRRLACIRIGKEKRPLARARQQQNSSHNVEREDRAEKMKSNGIWGVVLSMGCHKSHINKSTIVNNTQFPYSTYAWFSSPWINWPGDQTIIEKDKFVYSVCHKKYNRKFAAKITIKSA